MGFLNRRISAAGLTTAALLAVSMAGADDTKPPVSEPLEPAEAQAKIQVDPGLRVELVASEPEIRSPVSANFDEDGRLWVVEMPDYPNGPPEGQGPEGTIKILEDKDGDGHFETASVFAEGLLFANGLIPWKGGAIVTAAPRILWLPDEDGDGKADRQEPLYEGFTAGNPQLRVSHPILGLDGWIYVANGLRSGKVRSAANPDEPLIDLSGRDFRFNPISGEHEAIAGMGQYGNTFDDWGHRFVCTNRNHLIPIVLEDRYARRNPFLAAPGHRGDNQAAGGAARTFPISSNFTTSSLHAGTFSAACSVTIYRGDLLGDSYRGSAFTCDPTGNLVHQEVLELSGGGFRWHRAREGVEFLASPNDWFRPVNLADGPDGAFYLVDMDRAVIEHPEFMPVELKQRPDLLLGKDKGRIWRIVPEKGEVPRPRLQLSQASAAELVGLLEREDAWWRTTAQRLLLQRDDSAAREPLHRLVASSELPQARVHAAWLLEGWDDLKTDEVMTLLQHPHPRVREHGVLLAESRLKDAADLRERVVAMASDPDGRVRFQVALSLGEWDDDRILDPLARVALSGADDHWTRLAVESAVPTRAGALVQTLFDTDHQLAAKVEPGRLALLDELMALVGARQDVEEVAGVIETLWALSGENAARWRIAGLVGLADGLSRRGKRLDTVLSAIGEERAERVRGLLRQAVEVAGAGDRPEAERLEAIRLLAQAPWEEAEAVLTHLIQEDPDQPIRIAATAALSAHDRPEVAERLLASWPSYLPAVRREATQALLARPARVAALLDAIEAGRVAPGDLDAVATRRLVGQGSAESRARATKLLRASIPADRQQVLERYQAAVERKGDVQRGRAVFEKTCATCHHVAGVGKDVGPDIGDTRTKTKAMLLGDILNPNAAIDNNYVSYTVATSDGRVLDGIIASETSSALTLKRAEGQTDEVLRQDIEAIRSNGISLMPEGLEKDIDLDQMADLLEFLKSWRYVEGAAAATEPNP